jgi:hypothetical protein
MMRESPAGVRNGAAADPAKNILKNFRSAFNALRKLVVLYL